MGAIKFLVLFGALKIFSTVQAMAFREDCGETPMYPTGEIVGGEIIDPDEYSWLASLLYGNNGSYGVCGGSVISSWYVLTAAHCVAGDTVKRLGGLTGVRLGNFTQKPYCDYGTSNCTSYVHFGIANIIKHEHYNPRTFLNDIALIRVDSIIPFDDVLKPVCLPRPDVTEPDVNTMLTVTGWGRSITPNDSPAKRAVGITIVNDTKVCELQDATRMCVGVPTGNLATAQTSCQGDSGGPLMQECGRKKFMIEGIVSFNPGPNCVSKYFTTYFTRVRHYLEWIDEHLCLGHGCQESTSIVERKFPTDCGFISHKKGEVGGEDNIRPDGYSWLASLHYRNQSRLPDCPGYVINIRYVVTSPYCLIELNSVRLGDYDETGNMCNYVTENCTHYQEFGIDRINRNAWIGLIRVNRPIEFGPMMKPICLPYGRNYIPEPQIDTVVAIVGYRTKWTETDKCFRNVTIASTSYSFRRLEFASRTKPCYRVYDKFLMYQFAPQRMVLDDLRLRPRPKFFSRPLGDWLDSTMRL